MSIFIIGLKRSKNRLPKVITLRRKRCNLSQLHYIQEKVYEEQIKLKNALFYLKIEVEIGKC